MSHHLAVKAGAKPVAQRRRKMSQERADEVAKQTASLLEAGFIRELDYSTWLSNVVLVEAANKVILLGLKKRLDSKKGNWANEFPSVLWSYRTTEQSATGETPFRLTYGVDAVIPVEIGEPSPRLLLAGMSEAVEKDLIEETREMAHLTETALKQRIALRYNAKVRKRDFEEGDLVLRRNDIGVPAPGEGKLAVNWEGPYRVREVLDKGAYKLEKLDGKEIPRTWNVSNLKRFYS
ncbi:uncharacterized protein LOC107613192 [Arachis ipaensis]|uniref:uncharacterized protein LOC107613192 n=1 Tax=Arachis ipaensis TaxID=130454 RepID=UPI0007AF228B|nr:uncharacterized protein LOC107613192 [Arachis ipaensis]